MKKFLLCLLIIINMFNGITCSAENTVSYNINTVIADNKLVHELIIKGKYDKGVADHISFALYDNNNNLVMIKQQKTDSNGNFVFVEPIQLTGNFTVFINTYMDNVMQKIEFKILSEDEYQLIIDEFNKADATIEDYILSIQTNKDILGLNTKYFHPSVENMICSEMLLNKGKYTIYNFNKLFEESLIYSYLYELDDCEKIIEIINYYDNYFKIKSQEYPLNIYQSFCDLDMKLKTEVINSLKKHKLKDFDKIRNLFNENVVWCAFNNFNNTKLDSFIIKNNDYLKFNNYEKKSDIKKWEIINYIKNKSPVDSIDKLIKLYEESLKVPEEKPNKPSGGGGGDGGNISYEKPEVPVVPEKPIVNNKDFKDIDDVEWAKKSILNLYSKNIVSGKTETEFFPKDNITRAEFAKIMVCAFNVYEKELKSNFKDINEKDWYNSYVASAVKSGMITGFTDNTFRGDEFITREDMSLILYRALVSKKMVPKIENIKNPFNDFNTISDYARNAVLMLNNMGVISGISENTFSPKVNATRAEVCVLINKALYKEDK